MGGFLVREETGDVVHGKAGLGEAINDLVGLAFRDGMAYTDFVLIDCVGLDLIRRFDNSLLRIEGDDIAIA